MKQTKIVASISDRRCGVEFIRQLFLAGVNVVRMNTAHASEEGLREIISNTRKVSKHIGILIDTKGPEVRTTGTDIPIQYKTGEKVCITGDNTKETTHDQVNVSYENFVNDVKVGDHVLFDDGELDMLVTGKENDKLIVEVQNDGVLGSRKSVNVPGEHIDLPALTEKDRKNILLAIDEDIDFIAHSFVRNKQDVLAVQKILDEHNSEIKIISKIENQEGVDNIDEIIEASYGIMVARGDLGVEIPFMEVPVVQKEIEQKCRLLGKRVIIATEMLESMITNIRPTRAEISDVANAVYDGTSAIMLSGESAAGKYPVEAVKTMSSVAEFAEQHINYKKRFKDTEFVNRNILDAISHATCQMAIDVDAKCIVVNSLSGLTARMVSRFRVPVQIIGSTTSEKVYRKLALSWGVLPLLCEEYESLDVLLFHAIQRAVKLLNLKIGDTVVLTGGQVGTKGSHTNTIKVETVRKIYR